MLDQQMLSQILEEKHRRISIEAKSVSFADNAKKVIATAKAHLKAAQPDLFIEKQKPLSIQKVDWDEPQFFQLLPVTGVDDPKLAERISKAILHYMSHIEGGKELLSDVFKEAVPLKICFGAVKGSQASYNFRDAVISINFDSDFEALIDLLTHPPKAHVVPWKPPIGSPQAAVESLVFEFHNAAVRFTLDPLVWYHALMFQSASDCGLARNYCEFLALSRGGETIKTTYSNGTETSHDFNDWYIKSTRVDYNFHSEGTHAAYYEQQYYALFKAFRLRIEKIQQLVHSKEANAESDYSDFCASTNLNRRMLSHQNPIYETLSALEQAQLLIKAMKIRTCPEVQQELELDAVEKLVAQARMPAAEKVAMEDEPARGYFVAERGVRRSVKGDVDHKAAPVKRHADEDVAEIDGRAKRPAM
jgi:hypothetical protein